MRKKRGAQAVRRIASRAQASTEYIMVIAIGFVIILPLVYLFYSQSASQIEEVKINKMDSVGQKIVDTAESVYYQGKPARQTFTETFPDGVASIVINNNIDYEDPPTIFELEITMTDGQSLSYTSKVPLYESVSFDAQIAHTQGLKRIRLAADETVARGAFVELSIN